MSRRRTTRKSKIQHHHLLVRLETRNCPAATDKPVAVTLIRNIIRDIHMKLLGTPRVYYVRHPTYNEGLTALAPIQTSHIAFHFWRRPDRDILHNPASNCLLEFDLYTCGNLTLAQISRVLHHLTVFGPTHADITLLNRNRGLVVDRRLTWHSESGCEWAHWIDGLVPKSTA